MCYVEVKPYVITTSYWPSPDSPFCIPRRKSVMHPPERNMIAIMELRDFCDITSRIRESGFALNINEVVVQKLSARRNVNAVVHDACHTVSIASHNARELFTGFH
jgi:hypothetical protein